jgi:hypothetical protein
VVSFAVAESIVRSVAALDIALAASVRLDNIGALT